MSPVMKVAVAVCPLCQGTGWKPASGQRVSRCDCRLRVRNQTLLSAARIPKRYEPCELSNFDCDGPHSKLASARLLAGKFVEEYPVDTAGLLITGDIGVGKTHLAVGIIQELVLNKGIACLFYDYRELLKRIQNSYNATVQMTELELLGPVFDTEVLVLDELGAVKPTDWVWDTVSLILNTRYNDSRTTIITTNFKNEPAPKVGGSSSFTSEYTLGERIGNRMHSRLQEMCRIISMDGEDYRQKFKSASFR
jgi:DNA replication protein DnaC